MSLLLWCGTWSQWAGGGIPIPAKITQYKNNDGPKKWNWEIKYMLNGTWHTCINEPKNNTMATIYIMHLGKTWYGTEYNNIWVQDI